MSEQINLDMSKVLSIISGLGFKFKTKQHLEDFISTRTMVQRQGSLVTFYIDGVIAGKFTNN